MVRLSSIENVATVYEKQTCCVKTPCSVFQVVEATTKTQKFIFEPALHNDTTQMYKLIWPKSWRTRGEGLLMKSGSAFHENVVTVFWNRCRQNI